MTRLSPLLSQVVNPQRYVGEELNSIRKDLSKVDVTIALAFPEVYELGMSHLGIPILYHLCNQNPRIAAERVYCPWTDMEQIMRRERIPLFTLESKAPISEFDAVGFSLQSEFTYTNVINMIDLAGCEVFARDRKETFPLFIAGGPCVANPEPLADFMDAFLIGDGEELLLEFLERLGELKDNGISKEQMLLELAKIEGVYVPGHYEFTYDGPRVAGFRPTVPGVPAQVKRRYVKQLNREDYPDKPLVSAMEITHDRLAVEIMRGCTQGCRFCQAGYWYRPVRERQVEDVLEMATRGIQETGFPELGLCSLSTSDYSGIHEVTSKLHEKLREKKIALSLPSLRADRFSVELADNVAGVRKGSFTFALEAGSWRLREVINKSVTDENLCEAADIAYQKGWDLIKLYVMIGLPTETDRDLEELVRVVRQINERGRKVGNRKGVKVSVGAFVPKPFTPFQWEAFESLDVLRGRIEFLKSRLVDARTRVKWHDPESSLLETVLCRGDRRVGRAIFRAWKDGARYDGWTGHFNFERWTKAFAAVGLPLDWYTRTIGVEEILPWDVLDAGINKKYLLGERQKAFRQERTSDCKWGDCHCCGIKGAGDDIVLAKGGARWDLDSSWVYSASQEAAIIPEKGETYRVKFAKRSPLRFVSHAGLLRMFEMILRRADVPLVYSRGFHERPRIHFGPPLPVGLTSETEWTDFQLIWRGSDDALRDRLRKACPPGFEILEVHHLLAPAKSLSEQYDLARYEIRMTQELWVACDVDRKLDAFLRQEEQWIQEERPKGVRRVDMRKAVRGIDKKGSTLAITLAINDVNANNTSPYVFLKKVLGLSPDHAFALDIRRVGLMGN